MVSFLLLFLLLLDSGRSQNQVDVGSLKDEASNNEALEVSNSDEEHGGDGQEHVEEEEGSGINLDPLASLSPSKLLAPRQLPDPVPGFIDVAMILLGLQVSLHVIVNA